MMSGALYPNTPSTPSIYTARSSSRPSCPALPVPSRGQPELLSLHGASGHFLVLGRAEEALRALAQGPPRSASSVCGSPQAVHPRVSQLFREWERRITGLDRATLEGSEIRGGAAPSAQATTHRWQVTHHITPAVLFTLCTLQVCK